MKGDVTAVKVAVDHKALIRAAAKHLERHEPPNGRDSAGFNVILPNLVSEKAQARSIGG